MKAVRARNAVGMNILRDNISDSQAMISISYNDEKCYKCNQKNIDYNQMGDTLYGRCKTCNIWLKLRSIAPLNDMLYVPIAMRK